jgi:hypothetical protein
MITKEQSKQMYGVEDMEVWFEYQMKWSMEVKMLVMGMLSDTQELVLRGMDEEARTLLNQAKWVVRTKL